MEFPQAERLSTGLSTGPYTTYKHVVFWDLATKIQLSHIPQVLIVVITKGLNSWGLWGKGLAVKKSDSCAKIRGPIEEKDEISSRQRHSY